MKKLFFFDIDGTLLDIPHGISKISDETIKSMNKLKEQGHEVFLATGRCKCFVLDEVMIYPFSGYVTCNGGYVEYNNQCIYKNIVPSKAIEITHNLCKENGWLYYFESSDIIYVLNKDDPKHIKFRDGWGMKKETICDKFSFDEIETYIGMVVINDEKDIPLLVKKLSPYFEIQKHNSGCSFDLTLKNESKGASIKRLADSLGIDIENTIAFGDGRNDIEMLETVGLGIAMGNAVDEAKAVSDYVTDNVWDEGITVALKEFSFI